VEVVSDERCDLCACVAAWRNVSLTPVRMAVAREAWPCRCETASFPLPSSSEGGVFTSPKLEDVVGGGKQFKQEIGSTCVQRVKLGPWESQKCARDSCY